MEQDIIRLDSRDNVGVAVVPLKAGQRCAIIGSGEQLAVREDIAFGHKIALVDIPEGSPVIKYGESIALASRPIVQGSLVHIHNMRDTI